MDASAQMAAAKKFREYWLLSGDSEVGGYQKFWLSLIGDVLGASEPMTRMQFQIPVKVGTPAAATTPQPPPTPQRPSTPQRSTTPQRPTTPQRTSTGTKFLDAWIAETKVLIEHKARGIRLDAPQAGHGGKTPYEQALEYDNARAFGDKARWIVTSNFDEIWVYDREHPLDPPQKILLADLPKDVSRLSFLVDTKIDEVRAEEEKVSRQAGEIVARLYDAFLKRYNAESETALAALNRLCVRLVFCFYAEDAGLFPKDAFWSLLKNTPAAFLRERLKSLFRTLDTPPAERDRFLEPELAAFPYTNGGLFKSVDVIDVPQIDEEIRQMLIEAANFDWRDISPVIFGALFESTLNPSTRRAGGMVYTSPENIRKVIDPLFLDELEKKVAAATEAAKAAATRKSRDALIALQDHLASLTFLDPACGSGNFLTETFISLRRLENRIIAALQRTKGVVSQGELDLGSTVKVSINQFRGIEINDFAVAVAKTALWISEAKMLAETAEILHREPDYLPLRDYDGIIEANALRINWPSTDYIMGNPPFVGARQKSKEQAADLESLGYSGNVDYVAGWYAKAIATISGSNTRVAFVSTNSITQGEQVAGVFRPLVERFGLEIDFAWRTFRWDSEATEKAHVHCVIIGFHGNGGGACLVPRASCLDETTDATKDEAPRGTKHEAPRCTMHETRCTMHEARCTMHEARCTMHEARCTKPSAAANSESPEGATTILDGGETPGKANNIPLRPEGAQRMADAGIVGAPTGRRGSGATTGGFTPVYNNRRPFGAKKIFPSAKDAAPIHASHINPYLMDAPDVWIESRSKPICDVPGMGIGNKPIDGGNYLFTADEKETFIQKEPSAQKYFRKWYGSYEFLHNEPRWCLWLGDCTPHELRSMPQCLKRVQAVRDFRLASKSEGTRKIADKPTRFHVENMPGVNYLAVPKVSSERRVYIPMGFFEPDTICSDLILIIPNATLYHFGVLTSSVHMAWMRAVAGRLEMRYRYSANIVYNNFPWPEEVCSLQFAVCSSESAAPAQNCKPQTANCKLKTENCKLQTANYKLQTANSKLQTENCKLQTANCKLRERERERISQTAQGILDARALYPDSSLADLYDPLTMPPELRQAHAENDRAVLSAYGLEGCGEAEIVSRLFSLYETATAAKGGAR